MTVAVAELRSVADTAPAVLVTAVFGAGAPGPDLSPQAPPQLAHPERYDELVMPVRMVPFAQHAEYRHIAGDLPLTGGRTTDLTCWLRLRRPGQSLDAAIVTFLADALPPAIYGRLDSPLPVPTVDLVLHYSPALDDPEQWAGDLDGWTVTTMRNHGTAAGWAVDGSEVWSADGHLLVQARQHRRVLLPREAGPHNRHADGGR